jgi:hypothetical protein
MSRWFRHYAGMCSDPKFGGIARRAKVGRDRAVFVFAFILESASEKNEGGAFDWDADAVADLLNCPTEEIEAVYRELTLAGMVVEGVVGNWAKRQFESDKDATAAERQRRFRNKSKTVTPVTDVSRVTNAPQSTETDTENRTVGTSVPTDADPREADFRHSIVKVYQRLGYPTPATGTAVVWLKHGRDPEICLAVIEDNLTRKAKNLPLSYFEGPIADAHAAPRPGNPARPPPMRGKAENGWAALFRKSNGLGEFAHEGHSDDEQHWQAPGRAAIAGR